MLGHHEHAVRPRRRPTERDRLACNIKMTRCLLLETAKGQMDVVYSRHFPKISTALRDVGAVPRAGRRADMERQTLVDALMDARRTAI
jgi:hypothetical protein